MENEKREIDSVIGLLKDELESNLKMDSIAGLIKNIADVLARSEDIDYHKGMYGSYNLLGNANFKICNYHKAHEYFFKTLEIAEINADIKEISFALNNIGIVYFRLKQFDKALEYYNKALEFKLKLNDDKTVSTAYNNIGLVFNNLKQFDKALNYFQKALELDKNNNNIQAETRELNNIGLSYKYLGKTDDSLHQFLKSYKISRKNNYNKGMATALSNISNHYLTHNELEKAIEKSIEGIQLAEQLGSKNHLLHFFEIISEAYEKNGDSQNALKYFKKYSLLKDKIFSDETNSKMIEMQIKYESERKQRESEVYKNKTEELLKNNATKDKFFRIIHHDLLNPFTAIRSTAGFLKDFYHKIDDTKRLNYIDNILSSTDRLLKLMDNLFNWVKAQSGEIDYNPEQVDVNELLTQSVELYTNIFQTKEINVITELSDDCFANVDRNMIDTVIRNLIGNAIKFTQHKGIINIGIEKIDDSIVIRIKDNGVGIEQENINRLFKVAETFTTPGTDDESGTGLGLILSKEFIDINKGTISVNSKVGKGSEFRVELPVYY